MKWVMIGNAIIATSWIGAMAFLIHTNHGWWAGASLVAAIFSGYSYKQTKG